MDRNRPDGVAEGVASSWRWGILEEVCEGIVDCPHSTPKVIDDSPFLMARTQDITTGIFRFEKAATVSEATYLERTARAEPTPGDLLYSREGTYFGFAAVVPRNVKVCLGQRMVLLKPSKERVEPRFLRYWLNSPRMQNFVHGFRDGSVAERLNVSTIRKLPVVTPLLLEQRRIAEVLGALDDKIELNRKMNETLEQMAQAIFKSWFIDFDGHTEFQDSPLGPIPKGWRAISLAQTGKWVSGGTPNKGTAAFWNGNLPWFSAKSMGPLWLNASERRLTRAGATAGSRLVPRRTVLFIVRGMSLATEWRIGITGSEATLNQDLKGIVDNGSLVPELLLAWLLVNREKIRARADEAGHGTKRLPTEVLHSFALAVPERNEQEALAKPCQDLLAKIENNQTESQTLAELRDTLLPKLISGEIRIKDAERQVGQAT